VTADIPKQLRQIPRLATHIVASIGGNDAIRASGVIDERATSVAAALDRLAAIRDEFERNYRTVIDLLLEQSLPVALFSIYEPRYPVWRVAGRSPLHLRSERRNHKTSFHQARQLDRPPSCLRP